MDVRLSMCIPVYNCATFLGQALDSILSQPDEGIELVVYDGGSTDDTPLLMESYVKAYPNLRYYRGNVRGGIDSDMATCVGLARGEYCWLFSGDDTMRQGSIKRALELIGSGDDVYICKHTICNKEMVVFGEHPVLLPDKRFTAELSEKAVRQEWFRRAVTTEAFFSFMSGLIVRREKWQSGKLANNFNGSCWGHVARLLDLAQSGLRVCYVAEVWLDRRGENDSFADRGVVNRFRIAIEGYHKIADVFFGHDSAEAYHIRRVIRNEFGLRSFLFAKVQCQRNPERENKQLLDELLREAYSDKSFGSEAVCFAYAIFPCWLFVTARYCYRMMQFKNFRSGRHD